MPTPLPPDELNFFCRVCGEPTVIAPADGSPGVCEDCCEDHDYRYERGEGHRCTHCFGAPPEDHFDE